MTSNDIDATRLTLALNELRLPAIKAHDLGSLAALCRRRHKRPEDQADPRKWTTPATTSSLIDAPRQSTATNPLPEP